MRTTVLSVLFSGLFSFSTWAQISLVNVTGCGPQIFPSSTCTIPPTGSGHLLVVAWMASGTTTTVAGVSDNANNTYAEAGNARSIDTGANLMADIWYAKSSQSGATVLTITPNPSG